MVEESPQTGGLLATFPVAGTRLEHHCHHFFTHDAELGWLLRELGLESHPRFLPASMGICRDGCTHPFNGPADLAHFHPIGMAARMRFAASSLYLTRIASWHRWEEIPCLRWFETYAGRAATAAIWKPMLRVKFGPYAERVPAAWMIGRLSYASATAQGWSH